MKSDSKSNTAKSTRLKAAVFIAYCLVSIKQNSKCLPSFLLLLPLAANWHLLLHLARSMSYGFAPSLPPLKEKKIHINSLFHLLGQFVQYWKPQVNPVQELNLDNRAFYCRLGTSRYLWLSETKVKNLD